MSTKPIVYLEADKSWLFDGQTLTPCDFSAVKKYQSGAFIPLSKLQIGNYKFSSSLSDTEKQIQAEIKMHEDAGLSSNMDYEITSYSHVLEFEKSTLVEAFACSHENLEDNFGSIAKKVKVIDWVVPSHIAYESFYVNHDTAVSTTDLFYYLSDEESYAVLFQNGKYIAHRRTYSIEQLAKESSLDLVKCKRLLSEFGLNREKYPEEDRLFFDQLELIFSKQVEKIVHTINHKRGVFGIDGIDKIYVDFDGKRLDGLDKIFSAYGMENIPLEPLACEDDNSINSHRHMQAMYIYLCANDKISNQLNLTIYERQLPIYKRHVGILLGVGAAALLLALIHPSYYFIQNQILEDKVNALENRLSILNKEKEALNSQLQDIKDKREEDEKKIASIQELNKVYGITLDALPKLMSSRYVRQRMMYDALSILGTYKLSAISLEQNGIKEMKIHVISEYTSRENIAKFMKKWIDSGYSGARTSEIYLDENIYESKIEVSK